MYLIDQKHSDSTVWFYSDLVYLKNEKINSVAGVGKYSEKLMTISKMYSCFNRLDRTLCTLQTLFLNLISFSSWNKTKTVTNRSHILFFMFFFPNFFCFLFFFHEIFKMLKFWSRIITGLNRWRVYSVSQDKKQCNWHDTSYLIWDFQAWQDLTLIQRFHLYSLIRCFLGWYD